jgi:predicted metal-dependent peptidase
MSRRAGAADPELVERLTRTLKADIASLWRHSPFLGYLLLAGTVTFDPRLGAPAATDGRRRLFIEPGFFSAFRDDAARRFVLAHEVLHIAFRHSHRLLGRDPRLWNIATDAVINEMLRDLYPSGFAGAETALKDMGYDMVTASTITSLTGVPEDQVRKMSAEEIYELLASRRAGRPPEGAAGGEGGDGESGAGGEREGDLPNPTPVPRIVSGGEREGDLPNPTPVPRIVRRPGEEGEGGEDAPYDDYWERAVDQAAAAQRARGAGTLPGSLEAQLRRMRPKVRWRSLLRSLLVGGISRFVSSTYRVLHRKVPYVLPGEKRLESPTIWCVVDTSGSMVGKHLDQVVSEVLSIASMFRNQVRMVAWESEKAVEVPVKRLMATMRLPDVGGGTEIRPALGYLDKRLRRGDALIIMTDGAIFDIGEPDVQSALRDLSWRASVSIFLTTLLTPALPPRFRTVKIDVD